MKHDLVKIEKEENNTFIFKTNEERKVAINNNISTQKKNIIYNSFKGIKNR